VRGKIYFFPGSRQVVATAVKPLVPGRRSPRRPQSLRDHRRSLSRYRRGILAGDAAGRHQRLPELGRRSNRLRSSCAGGPGAAGGSLLPGLAASGWPAGAGVRLGVLDPRRDNTIRRRDLAASARRAATSSRGDGGAAGAASAHRSAHKPAPGGNEFPYQPKRRGGRLIGSRRER